MAARISVLSQLFAKCVPFTRAYGFAVEAIHRHRPPPISARSDDSSTRGLEPRRYTSATEPAVQQPPEVDAPDDVFDDVLAPEPREVSHTEVLERWEDRLRIVIVNV